MLLNRRGLRLHVICLCRPTLCSKGKMRHPVVLESLARLS